MDIRFISTNDKKIEEVKSFFNDKCAEEEKEKRNRLKKQNISESDIEKRINKELMKVNIISNNIQIEEIQCEDMKKVVKDKALRAFKKVGRPLIVEHTGLFFHEIGGYPGGLTQIFWEKLQGEKIVELFKGKEVTAKTIICFCDGKSFSYFEGEVEGTISEEMKGTSDFEWDVIFIPKGETETFAQLKKNKKNISMRVKSLERFNAFLMENGTKFEKNISYEDEIENLGELIGKGKVMLFVGAGISKNVGLPEWGELMLKLSQRCGICPELFEDYDDFLNLAEFYEQYDKDLYKMKKWMKKKWKVDEEKIKESKIHKNILKLDFPIIYTTNYDESLEKLYQVHNKKYIKIAKVKDLTEIEDGETEIIKFHGDYNADSQLVLTESSFFNRMNFESPLDIKLRADILNKSILFIGYSLSDINMRYILYKLDKLWKDAGEKGIRPKSYIFLSRPNIVQEDILDRRGIIPIVSQEDSPAKGLNDFLEELLKKQNDINKKVRTFKRFKGTFRRYY